MATKKTSKKTVRRKGQKSKAKASPKKEKRKPNKRAGAKYPGLNPRLNSRIKQEYLDQDYIAQLSEEEKQFLSNFNEEYYGGNFNHPGKKLHKTKKERRTCYNRNNAQNRCSYANTRAAGRLLYIDGLPVSSEEEAKEMVIKSESNNLSVVEDLMIELVDKKD